MAVDDIRVRGDFRDHPKTVRMLRRLGEPGVMGVVFLWIGVRGRAPSGDLSTWSAEDIEIEARWRGEPGLFVEVAVNVGFLERLDPTGFRVPSWVVEQRWAAHEPARRALARHAINRRWGRACEPGCPRCEDPTSEPPETGTPEIIDENTDRIRTVIPTSSSSTPPLSSSSTKSTSQREVLPSSSSQGEAAVEPAQLVLTGEVAGPVTAERVVDLWNETAEQFGLQRVRALTSARRKHLAARIREHPTEDFWRTLLARLVANPWNRGENDRGWLANIDYVIRSEDQPVKIMEWRQGSGRGAKGGMSRAEMVRQVAEAANHERSRR